MQSTPHNPVTWAQKIFGTANLGDSRRTDRLVTLASLLAKHTGKSLAAACEGNDALLEGNYRFIRNQQVNPMQIRKAGYESTVDLAQDIPVLLSLEDTTSLSYKHQAASELGKLGQESDKSRGFWVHSNLLLDARTQQTVGLIHQEWWMRPDNPEDADVKESGKWVDSSALCRLRLGKLISQVINVCDREADIFDYLMDKIDHQERFIVRAKNMRKVEESGLPLDEHLRRLSPLGGYELYIPQKGMVDKRGKRKNRPARKARLQIYSDKVTLNRGSQSLTLNVLLAEEVDPPENAEPVSWSLLTSEPVTTLDEALKVIQYYSARWRVEDFHKVWKSGAGVEELRMSCAENLERMGSILAFTAVRLMQLRESLTLPVRLKGLGLVKEAKEVSQMNANRVLTDEEIKLLILLRDKGQMFKPTLEWAYLEIARLGGFNDTKRTGIAGWDTLWEGWRRLQDYLQGYLIAKSALASGAEI